MANLNFRIKHEGEKGGYWMNDNNGNHNQNPHVKKKKDKIRWHAPSNKGACIILVGKSPFKDKNGRLVDKVLHIPRGGHTEYVEVADVPNGVYEYLAAVKSGKNDYTYVRGPSSPPGVSVGG